jgi:hypothetical protein
MARMILNPGQLFRRVVVVGCAALAFGCQPTPVQPTSPQPQVVVNGNPSISGPAARPEQIEGAIHSDVCAARLQQISGALLEYYAIHGQLPPTLEVLSSLSDLDQPLTFTCPKSDQPFIYVPGGLHSPGDARQIVVYDPGVDRAGLRWIVRMRSPRGREAAATWVEHVPATSFQTNTPAQPMMH